MKDAGYDLDTICRCEVLAQGEKKGELMRAQREFILGLIENALSEAEQQDQETSDDTMNPAQVELNPDDEPDKNP